MKRYLVILICLMGLVSNTTYASEEQMKTTLTKIIAQLEALKPLVNQASREQDSNPRVKIHFDAWTDADGKSHSGLKEDLDSIQQALVDVINEKDDGPRNYTPINGDFVRKDHV